VLENWHPGALSSRHKVDFTALIIPAAHPSWQSVQLDNRLAHCIPRNNDALKLLRSYLKLFAEQKPPQLVPEIVDSVTRHIIDLSFLTMNTNSKDCARETNSSIQAARTQAALAFIDGRFSDPNLTPARAAASLGISVRYLERLLEASGKSFGRRLLERRLEAARRLLSDPSAKALRITDIALQTGFSDLSHFSRRFRERFGASPAALRQANWISLTPSLCHLPSEY
jgi:AraC-like DNA-binding protein